MCLLNMYYLALMCCILIATFASSIWVPLYIAKQTSICIPIISSCPHRPSLMSPPQVEERHQFWPLLPSLFKEGDIHGKKLNHKVGNESEFEMSELGIIPTDRIYCKAGGNGYSVAIQDGKVILTQSNSSDPTQHWLKDLRYSTKVKDVDGNPSFALVNSATKQAMAHSTDGLPVELIHYRPDVLNLSVLWTESKDMGVGFKMIRMVDNIRLVLDAFHGDKDHGGVHDGTLLVLYKSWKGDNQNQQWKIFPY